MSDVHRAGGAVRWGGGSSVGIWFGLIHSGANHGRKRAVRAAEFQRGARSASFAALCLPSNGPNVMRRSRFLIMAFRQTLMISSRGARLKRRGGPIHTFTRLIEVNESQNLNERKWINGGEGGAVRSKRVSMDFSACFRRSREKHRNM